jgi:hypothetical protein
MLEAGFEPHKSRNISVRKETARVNVAVEASRMLSRLALTDR